MFVSVLGACPSLRRAFPALAALLVACVAGCASTGITPELEAGRIDNPANGITVRIGEVRDLRAFQASPARNLVPSLRGDLDDLALRSRAVGRATGLARQPAANILLEPPQTVQSLVADAAGRALRAAGYRVLEPGDPGFEEAIVFDFEIHRLWMMQNLPPLPPFVRADLSIRIIGPLLGFERGLDVEAERGIASGAANRALFRRTLEGGLDDWTDEARKEFERTRRALARDAGRS